MADIHLNGVSDIIHGPVCKTKSPFNISNHAKRHNLLTMDIRLSMIPLYGAA